jgi:hypothetical protein
MSWIYIADLKRANGRWKTFTTNIIEPFVWQLTEPQLRVTIREWPIEQLTDKHERFRNDHER